MTEENEKNQVAVSIGRQPVFDSKQNLWGYELFCISDSGDESVPVSDYRNVAFNIASSAYISLQEVLERGKKIIVDFNEKNIINNLPYALPPALTVIKVPGHLHANSSVMGSIRELKSDGYLIAVGGFAENQDCQNLLETADILCIDLSHKPINDLSDLQKKISLYKVQTIAEQVSNQDIFSQCIDLGFSYFHGSFFKTPGKITVKTISANQLSRFQMLKIIESKEPDFEALEKSIKADVATSFRLLSYLNSASFGFRHKIQSIKHAISMIGWTNIKKWLHVALLTNMAQGKHAAELIYLSVQRGKFLETVTTENDYWGFDPDSLFLLGMFSLLDVMLGMPMEEVVKHLPLEGKLKDALCRKENNEYLPLLNLAECFEEAKWDKAEAMIQQLSLNSPGIRSAFHASVNWAIESVALQAVK